MHRMVDGVAVPLTEAEIAERIREIEEFRLHRALNEYKHNRISEYPSLEDLLVALIEKEEGRPEALNELIAKRAEIKAKYPKPQ